MRSPTKLSNKTNPRMNNNMKIELKKTTTHTTYSENRLNLINFFFFWFHSPSQHKVLNPHIIYKSYYFFIILTTTTRTSTIKYNSVISCNTLEHSSLHLRLWNCDGIPLISQKIENPIYLYIFVCIEKE